MEMKKYLYIGFQSYTPIGFGSIYFVTGCWDDRYELNVNSFFTINNDIDITQGEKFYFLPGVSIPRIKLKDLYASTKSKTVRDASEATKIILGSKTLDAIADRKWYTHAKTEAVKELIELAYKRGDIHEIKHNELMDILNNYTEDIVLGSYDLRRCLEQYNFDEDSYTRYNDAFLVIKDDWVSLYEEIKDKPLYDEKALIGLVNADDSTTIDEDMYDTLCDMLNSTDKDNWVVAMEIMANSNYKESLLYLCFLFEHFSNKIVDQKSRNHVNFKSLCSYMGFRGPNYCHLSPDQIVNLLMEKEVFTKEMAIKILSKYKEYIEGHGNTDLLKVAKITFAEPVLTYLKEKEAKNEPECAE